MSDDQIRVLHSMGMSPQRISDELKIPLEKVEHILGLKLAVATRKHITVPEDARIKRYLTPEELLAVRPETKVVFSEGRTTIYPIERTISKETLEGLSSGLDALFELYVQELNEAVQKENWPLVTEGIRTLNSILSLKHKVTKELEAQK